jgi:hypothetical protein
LLTDRFRIMVAELAGAQALDVLRALARDKRTSEAEAPA